MNKAGMIKKFKSKNLLIKKNQQQHGEQVLKSGFEWTIEMEYNGSFSLMEIKFI